MKARLSLYAPFLAAVAALVASGCGGQSGGPGGASSPPPETIAAEIRPMLAPLETILNAPPVDNGNFALMDASVCSALVEQAAQAQARYSGSEGGRAGLAVVVGELQEMIRRSRDEDRWGALLCALDVHEQLQPGMLLMRRLRERALLHAQRPHVVVKGFFDDNDREELYVFMEVTTRDGYGDVKHTTPAAGADKMHMVQVRVEEVFYGLRLVDILGNKRGVVLEYLADPGHFFKVLAPPRELTPVRQALPSR